MAGFDRNNVKKILLLRNDKIGDFVVSSNVIRELKKAFPKARISLVASSLNKALAEKNKRIDRIIVLDYPPKGLHRLVKYLETAKKIRSERFDLGIDLRGSAINVCLLFSLGKVKYKVGFYNRVLSKIFLDYAYKKERKKMHSTKHRIDLINKALGLNSKNYWPDIAYDNGDEKEAKEIIRKNKLKKFIVINPDASLEKKQWSLEKFSAVIEYLKKTYPKYKIVLAGIDEKKINYLAEKNPGCITLLNENLRILYLLLKKSSLVIAPDGGLMHLAWAGKANLLTLMTGYLGIEYVGPIGKNSKVLVSDRANINSISVNDVVREIDVFLKHDKKI